MYSAIAFVNSQLCISLVHPPLQSVLEFCGSQLNILLAKENEK